MNSIKKEQIPASLTEYIAAEPSIWLTLTNRCNLRCKYCFNYLEQNHEDMSPELAVAIIDYHVRELREAGIEHPRLHILFFGGEPSLNPDALFAVMNYIDENQLECSPLLLTNGVIEPKLLDRLIEYRLFFQISFDGFANNLRITKSGQDSNAQVINTLEKRSTDNLPISLRCTIDAGNVDCMHQAVELAAKYKVTTVNFSPICMEGNAATNKIKKPEIDDYLNNYLKAQQMAQKLKVKIYSIETALANICTPRLPFVWLPDGYLSWTIKYSSTKLPETKEIIFGKFSLADQGLHFDAPRFEQIISNFSNNRMTHCADCEIFPKCRGWNIFDTYALGDSVTDYDRYSCKIAKRIMQHLH